jgi:hypothetical protein
MKKKLGKLKKKSNFEKKTKKREKLGGKKSGEESLWIIVVIHGEMCGGEQ